jgi:hypothetical protein
MKISTHITAALLALGIVSQVSADPVVYLTGSTAFRSTVEATLANNSGTNAGGLFDAGSVTMETWGNANPASANYMIFHGTINGSPIYVNCAWSGSEAGIASACNTTLTNVDRNGNPLALAGSPEVWVDVSNAAVDLTAPPGITNTANPSSSIEENGGVPFHGADLAQADTSQAVSWTPYKAGTQTALKSYGVEAVVTFVWTKNVQTVASNEWLDMTNVTLPQIDVMLANGVEPAGFFSGNTNDNDFTVYLVGRNLGSGTRMNELSDSLYGGHNPVQQYSIGYGCGDPGDPAQENALILTNEANNGYESGSGVAKALANTGSCQQPDPFNGGKGWFAIGMVGPADALNTGNYGGEPTNNWLTVDGVPESNAAIENGPYYFWGHENLYGKFGITNPQDDVGNRLLKEIKATMALPAFHYGLNPGDHDPGILGQYMNVGKSSDTAFPTPGNTGNGYP